MGGGHCYSSFSPSSGQIYLLHNALRNMDVLHGDDLCQFIQAVDILDLIQELHTAEDNGTTTTFVTDVTVIHSI